MSSSPPDVPGKDATPASTAEPTPGETLPPSKRWPSVRFLALSLWVAIAVLVDATIIRTILLPASMKLLGEWNWYLPAWLQWLPHLEIEAPPDEQFAALRAE